MGINLQLTFHSNVWSENPEDRVATREFVDFDKEAGKVGFLISSYFSCIAQFRLHGSFIESTVNRPAAYIEVYILFPAQLD